MRITFKQIQLVLDAVAELEGWDAEHPSILCDETGWAFKNGLPVPSPELVKLIKEKGR
jgi:hypothetical protein